MYRIAVPIARYQQPRGRIADSTSKPAIMAMAASALTLAGA